ncbi:MAG: hypothetical protein GWM90_13945 [Gemmatimonadetes bacterium]|nr:hypothetical protein [Gemmatimonadota bacterium]NIQ55222.1 hypothetical protein [Gemmatimonadota bacterium]NIU75426.1 hypothetical protein [Gammaproteobacteria bacterium]NIX45171.1 hypothetical protein [Gemmatimonadota bacterium]NIY09414.1 hypothetical protein [Gemmatimonadota bacterium]
MALLLAAVAPVRAQVPGVEFRLNPRIGLYAPLSNLGEASIGTSVETFEMQSSFAIGLGAELQLPALPFGIRANLDYATSTSVDTETGLPGEAPNASLLALVGDLVFRPLPSMVVVEPYFLAGGGIKSYDFDTSGTFDPEGFATESDPTLHLGAGLDFGAGPFGFNAELSDYISWFELVEGGDSEMQHDVFITVGFSIGLL